MEHFWDKWNLKMTQNSVLEIAVYYNIFCSRCICQHDTHKIVNYWLITYVYR